MEHWIDHLVLAAPALASGIAHVERLTGVAPEPGGAHPGMGSHNALLSLGAATYLVVLAPAPGQGDDATFRAADAPPEPRLVTFAVGCRDLDATVAMLRAG